jgi:hypothetical protein
MAGKESGAPFQRIEELQQENEVLRDRVEEAEGEIERLRRENEQLRRELKAAGRESKRGKPKSKTERKKPGRKAGQGPFTFRQAPAQAGSAPPVDVPVTTCQCPGCGGELRYERTDEATVASARTGLRTSADESPRNSPQASGVGLWPATIIADWLPGRRHNDTTPLQEPSAVESLSTSDCPPAISAEASGTRGGLRRP